MKRNALLLGTLCLILSATVTQAGAPASHLAAPVRVRNPKLIKTLRRAVIAGTAALAIGQLPLKSDWLHESPSNWSLIADTLNRQAPLPSVAAIREHAIADANAWKDAELKSIGDPRAYLDNVIEQRRQKLQPFVGTPFLSESKANHRVQFLSTGIQGMATHLELIRTSDSVSMQYYFFDQSSSARIVLNALIDRCSENPDFRAQILVDYYGWDGQPGLTPEIVHLMRERTNGQIEFKYFNVSGEKQFWNVGHRDHSKLFVARKRDAQGRDHWTAVTGSANIGDESRFVANSYFLFQESEWRTEGPVVERMAARFQEFWKHKYSRTVPEVAVDSPEYQAKLKWNQMLLSHDDQIDKLEQRFLTEGADELKRSPVFEVGNVTFVSDRPGKDNADRVMNHYLMWRMAQARERVLLENYAALIPDAYWKTLVALKAEGVPQMRIHTNGFDTEASDPRMPLLTLKHIRRAEAVGIDTYEYLGKPLPGQVFLRKKASAFDNYSDVVDDSLLRAGVHSKLWLFDDVVGNTSANFDPRSTESIRWGIKSSNIEMGLFVRDRAFADYMAGQMELRLQGAKRMDAGGLRYADGTPIMVLENESKGAKLVPVDQPGVIEQKATGKDKWFFRIPFLDNIF